MKVYVLPADPGACGHNRLIWPAEILRRQGHDITILPPGPNTGFLVRTVKDPVTGKEYLKDLQCPQDMDVLVLQRPAHPLQPQMIKMLRDNGHAVVVDMDDDMSTIHPDNGAFQMYRQHSMTKYSWRYGDEACKLATMVTTSTAALQKTYAKHGRGMIIDNYVPQAYLKFPKLQTWAFGWAGAINSHPNDTQITRPAVQQLIDAGYPFQMVGSPKGVRQAMGLKDEPIATGYVSLSEWAIRIADNLDVMMIPLAPTVFNSGKSRLKGIEAMAVGVPWVASPRAEYRKLAKESGVGFLAEKPKEWFQMVKKLLDDDVLLKEQAEAGKEYMKDQTYEAQSWRHLEAWTKAYEIDHGKKRT